MNIYIYIFLNIYLFILAALGLSYSLQDLLVAAACGIYFPGPGIEPGPPALGARSLTHWTTREVPVAMNIE